MTLRFVDLFAGLGGFHHALKEYGFECVFASESDEELRAIYDTNFSGSEEHIHGDIREHKTKIPPHDILCAGFPCQPFSKSGSQLGVLDQTRGTLFHEILDILRAHKPEYVILENVGNFERHDNGRTWALVKESLQVLGYQVKGTEHIGSGGQGLLSPAHFGHPQSRERFFIVARRGQLPANPFPRRIHDQGTALSTIVQSEDELDSTDISETRLSERQIACINHWNQFFTLIPSHEDIPSFPLWGDEIDANYPFIDSTPYSASWNTLRACLNGHVNKDTVTREEMLALLPSYARTQTTQFPQWKVRFIKQNRDWFRRNRAYLTDEWVAQLREFPPSLRKLEWNCHGGERDLWKYVLQFRPSGLRAKRYTSTPALVAMTTTQIPILGPERRFLTRIEGLRLQGFPDSHILPSSRAAAFRALGNAVHVDVVQRIVETFILPSYNANTDDSTNSIESVEGIHPHGTQQLSLSLD